LEKEFDDATPTVVHKDKDPCLAEYRYCAKRAEPVVQWVNREKDKVKCVCDDEVKNFIEAMEDEITFCGAIKITVLDQGIGILKVDETYDKIHTVAVQVWNKECQRKGSMEVPPEKVPKTSNITTIDMKSKTCSKDTGGSCNAFKCRASRNAKCVDDKCVCGPDECAEGGRCVQANPAAPAPAPKPAQCSKETGGTCGVVKCKESRNARCVDSKCICDANQCAGGGKCVDQAAKPDEPRPDKKKGGEHSGH